MIAIKLNDVSFSYQKNIQLINHLTLEFTKNTFNLLIGPSGCGKSTLLKIISQLYPKYAGKMTGVVNLGNLRSAMMFQNPNEQFTMTTPRQEIIFALENLAVTKVEYQKRLKTAAAFTKINTLLDQDITTLSGGEKQRVALAVLVAMNVDIFLLDEPFASVDPINRKFLINKLATLKRQGKTIIISDHLFTDYVNLCDHVFQFQNSKIVSLSALQMKQLFNVVHRSKITFSLPLQNKTNIFKLNNFSIKQNRILLNQLKLTIPANKSILITGANGIGKTSFFKVLTKMLPYTGQAQFKDKEITKYRTRKYLLHVAQIFQNADDQFLSATVRDEIQLSKKLRNNYFTDQKITQSLIKLNLDKHLDQVVYSLSGGQKKKLQILLMLITQHEVLLIDEPLAGLDHESAKVIVSLLQDSQKALKQTYLIISHQIGTLDNLCDYLLNFDQKKLTYLSEVNYES